MSDAHDKEKLYLEFGVPSVIVSTRALIRFLASIGVSTNKDSIRSMMLSRGIRISRYTENLKMAAYPKEAIERLVRGMTGVPMVCWLEARLEEREKSPILKMYGQLKSGATAHLSGVKALYAAVYECGHRPGTASGKYLRENVVIDQRTNKPLISHVASVVHKWDPSFVSGKWKIYKYHDVFPVDPRAATKRHIAGLGAPSMNATILLTFWHFNEKGQERLCRLPAGLLGYDKIDGELPAVMPVGLNRRRFAVAEVIRRYRDCWLWVWRQGWEVDPSTLEIMRSQRGSSQLPEFGGPRTVQIIGPNIPDSASKEMDDDVNLDGDADTSGDVDLDDEDVGSV